MDVFIRQMEEVLTDLNEELAEIRRLRREVREKTSEYDAREIDLLLAIKKTKETLENLGAGEY